MHYLHGLHCSYEADWETVVQSEEVNIGYTQLRLRIPAQKYVIMSLFFYTRSFFYVQCFILHDNIYEYY